jgi:hypothetical protein
MKHRQIKIFNNGEYIKTVKNCKEAERETGVKSTHIPKYCAGKLIQSRKGFSFLYADEIKKEI